jgi:hypothetical protein
MKCQHCGYDDHGTGDSAHVCIAMAKGTWTDAKAWESSPIAARLPNGEAASNVYEAYEIGLRQGKEEAAKICDVLARQALEDMDFEKDERFGVYAKKYRFAAYHIRKPASDAVSEVNKQGEKQ